MTSEQQKIRLGWICVLLVLANIGVAVYLFMTPPRPANSGIASSPPIEPPRVISSTQPSGGTSTSASKTPSLGGLRALIPVLKPLHEAIHPPGPNDWLANHKEPGQTFEQYLTCKPITLHGDRRVICIQPLGELPGRRKEIVDLSAEFMGLYFGAEVRVMESLPLDLIPADSRRDSRGYGEQIKSTVVLDDILKPRLPKDAAAYIAFTASDLYPKDSWNFVFGQASLYHRVGVWSLARFGNPDRDFYAFRLCLLRTIKTATHETGHIFSMYHCTLHECNMNGSNHQVESDNKPLWLCPECLGKVLFATRQEPKERFRRLAAFARTHQLEEEAAFYEKSLKELGE